MNLRRLIISSVLLATVFVVVIGAGAAVGFVSTKLQAQSYYAGVFDSCMVVVGHMAKLPQFTTTTYEGAWDYCTGLTDSAKERDAFQDRLDFPPPADIDL